MVDIDDPTDEDLVTLTREDIEGVELVETVKDGDEEPAEPEAATESQS